MKNVLHIFLLIAALSCAAMAQSDFDEPKWTKFEPEREEFSLDLPGAPAWASGRNTDQILNAEYHVVQNKTYFAVFSQNTRDDSLLRSIMGLAAGDAVPKDIEIDGIKGQRYDFKGSDDYEHSFIAIQAPAHFYIFQVFSETRDNPMIEGFLGSVKLNRQMPKVEQLAEPASISAAARNDILKSPSSGSGIGGATGSKSGSGSGGVESLDSVAPPKSAKIDSPVTFLVKPMPSYTTMARRYKVSGTVKLRITFQKNGEIGNITAITKLPLGLTQSAISAARNLKFSPALRKGEPYAVSKVVEYVFYLN